MRARAFYQHEDCTDSFLEVIKVQYFDAKRVKLRVFWCIQGATKSWPVGLLETIEIQRKDLPKWKEIKP